MKIAIDISQIGYKGTGVSRYTERLVDAIVKYDKKNAYTFFFSSLRQKLNPDIEAKIKHKFTLKKFFFPPTLLEIVWNRLHILPLETLVGGNDITLTSDWTEPPAKAKKITVVHDLVFIKSPETLDQRIIGVQKRRFHWIKKETSLIIADSHSTKNDIIHLLGIKKNKIVVVYPAVEVTPCTKNEIADTIKKYHLNKPFILTVGKLEPRKNIERLINAFLKAKLPNVELVIVGMKGWGVSSFQLPNSNFQNIRFLGYIPDNELYALYQSALFFVYPSLYEGFGYPVVEAMKLGCPVATSNTSSLKEIAQDGALLFDPLSEKNIAQSLITLFQNNSLRKQLREKGEKRANNFSLKNFAPRLIKVIETVYDHRN